MSKKSRILSPDAPLLHRNHKRPVTRRDFLAQGLTAGLGLAMGPSIFSLFANPRTAQAAFSDELKKSCRIAAQGAGKIPFICFDLAGGANISGSNVLVGQQGGQLDFLSTSGYNKLGLPGDMAPFIANADTGTHDFINTDLGLAFHSDSAFLRGIQEKTTVATQAGVNGAVIPARSDNDTGNNPHNPMYAINKAGADGELLTLIGSRSSESGGNSVAPAAMIDASLRPTKIDRPSDVTGLVDTGKLVGLLKQDDAVAVLESIRSLSKRKMDRVSADDVLKHMIDCGYVKAADLVDRYGDPKTLNPEGDENIIGPIFSQTELENDAEFRKTASVMKMVVNGFAGAGTITMGGYDYHTGDRSTGEIRDLRAGRCIGACLEYAARFKHDDGRVGMPLMIYVFSDGSVASNGTIDDSIEGRGKGVWTGDNSSTAASFFLVYDPNGKPTLMDGGAGQQIGHFSADASVDTASSPAANNVNLLVETVALNYMALHGEQGNFSSVFSGLSDSMLDGLTVFNPIVTGTI